MIKNGPSMYLNDKKWPIDVPIKTGTPIHVPHFRKKKGPIDVPGSLILRPMFAAHPYNHFVLSTPHPLGVCVLELIILEKKNQIITIKHPLGVGAKFGCSRPH